jgi:hypothetical protein
MLNKKLFIIIFPVLSQISCMGRHPPRPVIATQPTYPELSPLESPPPYQTSIPTDITPDKPESSQSIITEPQSRPKTVVIEKKVPVAKTVILRAKPKPLFSATIALVNIANQQVRSGQLEAAVVSLERALRIEPRNALLTYKLAELKLKQSKPRLAENLAQKSALLAAADSALKKKSWQLIVQARRLQKNYAGAKKAQEKVQSLN